MRENNNTNNNHQIEVVKKSNKLIQALGNPSLLAEKVLLLSLVKVEDRDSNPIGLLEKEKYQRIMNITGTDFSKGLVAEISNNEIRNLTGSNSGSYYSSIRKLLNPSKTDSKTLRNNLVFMAPDDSGVLGYTELITSSVYEDGVMYIKFNPEESIKKEIIDLKNNYSLLSVGLMLQWKSVYSYRVYELIQSNVGYEESARKKANKPQKSEYKYTYEFGELKFLLGILDATADAQIQKEISDGKHPNYNKIAEDMTKRTGAGKTCTKYADLKRYALDKAEKEINDCDNRECEYNIHFEPIRAGRGGKVTAVDIYVKRKANTNEDIVIDNNISEDDKLDFIDVLRRTSLGNLPTKDLKCIAEAAGYSMDKVNEAIAVMEKSSSVDNVTGFMISAISNKWKNTEINKEKKKTEFHNFKKNDYDFEELEKKLINA